jgi:hypothetical protein
MLEKCHSRIDELDEAEQACERRASDLEARVDGLRALLHRHGLVGD